jgi:3-hydroxyisobutyrate dehydrogenase-like beta-hydroxyacid dehydrogenase
MENIVVIGMGIIGATWAKNWSDSGKTVLGWNRSPKPELPFFTHDLVGAVKKSQLVVIVVADPPAVSSILEQILPVLTSSHVVMQCSTISPKWTLEFAQSVQKTGARFLEAPFTGSKLAAEARKTVYYIGGDQNLAKELEPTISLVSTQRIYIGELGKASALKLAMNLNLAGVAASLCESFALTRAQGVPDEVFWSALEVNIGRSGVSDLKKEKLTKGNYSPQFSLKHMDKDLRLALETAGNLNLPQTKSLKAFYEKGMELGWGEEDFIVLTRLLEPDHS